MAILSGSYPGGRCVHIRQEGDWIVCDADVPEEMLAKGTTNHLYDWRARLTGQPGESVRILIHWPPFDPGKVTPRESVYWFCQSFAHVVERVFFASEDGLRWTRLEGVERDGFDFRLTVTLPASGQLELSVNLPFTLTELEAVCTEFAPWREPLGKTIGGRDLPLFRFGTGKRIVWLQANQHIGECSGCHVLTGLMRTLAKPGTELRDLSFFVVPTVSVEKMLGAAYCPRMPHDINRDWFDFVHPETQAIRDKLAQLTAQGLTPTVMIDMHNGWCRQDDSGGNITEYNRGFVSDAYRDRRLRFTRAMLAQLDYERPDKIWWRDPTEGLTFFQFGSRVYEALCYTWEFSRYELWNRKAGAYEPLTQERLELVGQQLAEAILSYPFE